MIMARFPVIFFLAMATSPWTVSSEFYSDVDTKAHDEAKALTLKAKHFWEGLMAGASGLEATRNAELSARVEHALKRLPQNSQESGDDNKEISELFMDAIGHLAKADSMLFEEAARAKMTAMQRLEKGPSRDSLSVYVSANADALYTAYTEFVGYKTYEKKLAHHIIERLKEAAPTLDRASGMAPKMYEESDKAKECARAILKNTIVLHKKKLHILALDIIGASSKQRTRFQNYLYDSLMVAAEDMAGEKEKATQTVMRASLRGMKPDEKPAEQVDQKPAYPLRHKDDEPPMVFHDGVPVDAVPINLVF